LHLVDLIARDRLLSPEEIARVRWLQANKGYTLAEALGPARAELLARATARAERARRGLSLAGIARVFRELAADRGALLVLVVLSAGSALISFPFVFAWYLRAVLDHVVHTQDVGALLATTAVAATSLVASIALDFLLGVWASRCNFYLNQRLVIRAWSRVIAMPFPRYQRQAHSQLMTRLTQVLEVLQKDQLQVLRMLIYSLCILVMTTALLVSSHVALTLVFFPAVIATYLVPAAISQRADAALREEPRLLGRVTAFLQIAFAAQLVVRQGSAAEQRGIAWRVEALGDAHFGNQARKWLAWNLGFNAKVTLNLLTFLAMLWGGGALYLAGALELSELASIYLLVTMVTPKLDPLYRLYVGGQSLRTNYEVLDEILDLAPADAVITGAAAPRDDAPPAAAPAPLRTLRLDGVSFRYRPDGPEVVRAADLELHRGQCYLLAGPSGAGKSTLVDLLLGLLVPDAGRLLVDGAPLEDGARPALWRRVSLHEQSNFIFLDRTAAANLPAAPDPEWRRVADELGLATWGGRHASELSGGERQRLCLLRTLARPADLYVFDEPTSALDAANAAAVIAAIRAKRAAAIVLVISHDPALRAAFDRVITIEEGVVAMTASEAPA
jgi:ABC-type multidrug transport system fused ATPase/permease subunit